MTEQNKKSNQSENGVNVSIFTDKFSRYLSKYYRGSYSQLCQDLLGIFVMKGQPGIFVEIGANHPNINSNTFLLEKLGWKGVLVEPSPRFHPILQESRDALIVRKAVTAEQKGVATLKLMGNADEMSSLFIDDKFIIKQTSKDKGEIEPSYYQDRNSFCDPISIEVETISISELASSVLDSHGDISFLSIDTEGNEDSIIVNFPFELTQPKLICLEHNNDQEKIETFRRVLLSRGYVQVFEEISKWDAWFVHSNTMDETEQNDDLFINIELKDISSLNLSNLKELATFFAGNSNFESALMIADKFKSISLSDSRNLLFAARIYAKTQNYHEAKKCARKASIAAHIEGDIQFVYEHCEPFLMSIDGRVAAFQRNLSDQCKPEKDIDELRTLNLRDLRNRLKDPHSLSANKVYIEKSLEAIQKDAHKYHKIRSNDYSKRIELAEFGTNLLPTRDRYPNAGMFGNHANFRYQSMFNGIRVLEDCYYGRWMSNLIYKCKGHHEPQEEIVFEELLNHIRSDGVMLELGAYWSFYSIWFLCERGRKSKSVIVEPNLENIKVSLDNLSLNNVTAEIHRGFISDNSDIYESMEVSGGSTPTFKFNIEEYVKRSNTDCIDIIHADIQGLELSLLHQIKELLQLNVIKNLVISTHGFEMHKNVLRFLSQNHYYILCDVSPAESYSYDGLIVARNRFEPKLGYLDVPRWNGEFSHKNLPSLSVESSIILIDNTIQAGYQVKIETYFALKLLGYEPVALGYKLHGDAYIKYDPDDALLSMNFKPDEIMTFEYKGINLWHHCKGSIGYELPGLDLNNITSEEFTSLSKIYSRAIRFIDCFLKILDYNQPNAIIVWGGSFIEPSIMSTISKRCGIPVFAIEFSFDANRMHFDESGRVGNDFSFNDKWITLKNKPLSQAQLKQVSSWVEANYAGKYYRGQKAEISERVSNFLLQCTSKPILLIGQCYVDTVISYDNPWYKDTLSAYYDVIELCEKIGQSLIVKCHPGDKEEYKTRLKEKCEFSSNVLFVGLDVDENVYSLMDEVIAGITINSQAGLEMLAKGKRVLCLGRSFYSDAGLCSSYNPKTPLVEFIKNLQKSPSLTIVETEAVHHYLYHLLWGHLIDVERSPVHTAKQLRERIGQLVIPKNAVNPALLDTSPALATGQLRILICHASPSWGGSGYYLQDLALELQQLGHVVSILSEGTCAPFDRGVRWKTMRFSGSTLDKLTRDFVDELKPNLVLEVGVRSKPMRAALEVCLAHRTALVVQAEDDEFVPFKKHYPGADERLLEQLDYDVVFPSEVANFVKNLNLPWAANVVSDAEFDRWVDPSLRLIMYHMADSFCAIWHPMAERLNDRFGKMADLLPPIVRIDDYDTTPLKSDVRESLRRHLDIPEDALIFFINGSIYSYSDEFKIFSEALDILIRKTGQKIALLTCGQAQFNDDIRYIARPLGHLDIDLYNKYIKLSDLICVPGVNNSFNKYRLSSRLVKAMIFKKPFFTFKTGFAESLEDDVDGLFVTSDSPVEWAEVLEKALSAHVRDELGKRSSILVSEYFDAAKVAAELATKWQALVAQKAGMPKSLATGLISNSTFIQNFKEIYETHVPYPIRRFGTIDIKPKSDNFYQLKPGIILAFGFNLKKKGRMKPGIDSVSVSRYFSAFTVTGERKSDEIKILMKYDQRVACEETQFLIFDRLGCLKYSTKRVGHSLEVSFKSINNDFIIFSQSWKSGEKNQKEFWALQDVLIVDYKARVRAENADGKPIRKPLSSLHILASDLDKKYGWYDLERKEEKMWRWAGCTDLASVFIPKLIKGQYSVELSAWGFHDFNIEKDLKLIIFGRHIPLSEQLTQEGLIWLGQLNLNEGGLSKEMQASFIFNKKNSPHNVAGGDDKRMLSIAFQYLKIQKLDTSKNRPSAEV